MKPVPIAPASAPINASPFLSTWRQRCRREAPGRDIPTNIESDVLIVEAPVQLPPPPTSTPSILPPSRISCPFTVSEALLLMSRNAAISEHCCCTVIEDFPPSSEMSPRCWMRSPCTVKAPPSLTEGAPATVMSPNRERGIGPRAQTAAALNSVLPFNIHHRAVAPPKPPAIERQTGPAPPGAPAVDRRRAIVIVETVPVLPGAPSQARSRPARPAAACSRPETLPRPVRRDP